MPLDVLDRPALRKAILVAAALFFAAAVGHCSLEVHSSTDTWIGLACGRQIAESPAFPVNDTFSFTAAGQPAFNQNWLTHRIQYWFYSTLGPDSVVYAHWATVLIIHLLIVAATWWRTRSLLAALITGGVVAFTFRDYLAARPATMGYLCMAITWAMLCAIGADRKTPWWPLPILAAALLVWGQVHGSFTFGFGVVGLFIVQAVVLRVLYRKSDTDFMKIPTPQILALGAVLAIGVAGSVLLSPFGLENLKHGEKIRESEIFRLVNEWYPTLGERAALASFPPVWRFGQALAVGVALLVFAAVLQFISRATAIPTLRTRTTPAPDAVALPGRPVASNLLFDLVILAITIVMMLWARRFGPTMFLFAGPIVATWIVALAARTDGYLLRIARAGLALASVVAAAPIVAATAQDMHDKLIVPLAGASDATLLDRFTMTHMSPLAEIEFLRRNEIAGRVFCEWTQAAMVMWHLPDAKVFIDGRAQQVYDEQTYVAYVAIDISKSATPEMVLELIDGQPAGNVLAERPPVDIVIIRIGMSQTLQKALDQEVGRTWVLAFATEHGFVYLRKDSEPFRALAARMKSGQEWRPETADAIATRGEVYFNLTPPDFDAALACFKAAAAADHEYVVKTMPVIMRIEREAGRLPELLAYINGKIERFSAAVPGISEEQARVIRSSLGRFRDLTVRAMSAESSNPADRTP